MSENLESLAKEYIARGSIKFNCIHKTCQIGEYLKTQNVPHGYKQQGCDKCHGFNLICDKYLSKQMMEDERYERKD